MSSIQFNYFADEKGEQIIKQELLDKFGSLYVRESCTKKDESVNERIVESIVDSSSFIGWSMLLTSEKEMKCIKEDEDRFVDKYESPVIEYGPSKIRDDKIYISGRLAYFGANEFPEFKKEVQSAFRKLKKHCWRGEISGYWVFSTIGDEATVFIPNRIVHLKKQHTGGKCK